MEERYRRVQPDVAALEQASDAQLRSRVYELIGSLLHVIGELNTGPTPNPRQEVNRASHVDSTVGFPRRLAVAQAADGTAQVPLLQADGLVVAGSTARVRLRIANDGDSASLVTLYCSNFIADTGYEIPAVRVTMLPRQLTLAAHGDGEFEVEVAVPQQTPMGSYAGLIRALGNPRFKVVLSLEVS